MSHRSASLDARQDRSSPADGSRLSALSQRLRRPVAGGAYSAEIDGLRFIAIAIVVVGHFMERAVRFFPVAQDELASNRFADLVQRPGMGVYLFFAVSGFILARQAMKATVSPLSRQFLKSYFGRRILRIEPPYVILLVATWLVLTMSGYTPERTNHFDAVPRSLDASLIGSIFYVHDLVWGTFPRLFPPGWSLEIEVQFYLLAPVLFWAQLRTRSTQGRFVLGAVGLIGGALVSVIAPRQIGVVHTSSSLLEFFHFFWLGILIAQFHDWIVAKVAGRPTWLTGWLGWSGLVCYLVLPNAPDNDIVTAMAVRAATLAALLAMFAGAFARGSSFRTFCARPWISVIGGACYSIYLTHLQVIQVTTGVLAKLSPHAGIGLVAVFLIIETAAVVCIGLAFYALIERTFMFKDWPERFRTSLCRALCAFVSPIGGRPTVRSPRADRKPRESGAERGVV